jgi:hypothetical protein
MARRMERTLMLVRQYCRCFSSVDMAIQSLEPGLESGLCIRGRRG